MTSRPRDGHGVLNASEMRDPWITWANSNVLTASFMVGRLQAKQYCPGEVTFTWKSDCQFGPVLFTYLGLRGCPAFSLALLSRPRSFPEYNGAPWGPCRSRQQRWFSENDHVVQVLNLAISLMSPRPPQSPIYQRHSGNIAFSSNHSVRRPLTPSQRPTGRSGWRAESTQRAPTLQKGQRVQKSPLSRLQSPTPSLHTSPRSTPTVDICPPHRTRYCRRRDRVDRPGESIS